MCISSKKRRESVVSDMSNVSSRSLFDICGRPFLVSFPTLAIEPRFAEKGYVLCTAPVVVSSDSTKNVDFLLFPFLHAEQHRQAVNKVFGKQMFHLKFG